MMNEHEDVDVDDVYEDERHCYDRGYRGNLRIHGYGSVVTEKYRKLINSFHFLSINSVIETARVIYCVLVG